MKKCCLLLLCLILLWAFAACRVEPTVVLEDGSFPPTGVPGEPEGVPGNQINGSLSWHFL